MKADVPKFKCGDIVYHLADGCRGVVNAVVFGDDGIEYRVASNFGTAAMCSSCELTKDYEAVKHLVEEPL